MTTRILPPAEWHRLPEPPLPAIRDAAIDGHVVVVEDGDEIVGCWVLMRCLHVEGCWIAPAHRRKVSVARRLYCAMRELVHGYRVRGALGCFVDADALRIVERHGGTEVLGRHLMLTFEGAR
jgi:hypothetical protein